MAETISIFGVKELDDFFQKMRKADQKKIIFDSWREGTKPLIAVSKQLLKSKIKTRSTRTLEKSIGFVQMRSRSNSVFISAKVGARRFGNFRGYHGHLFDAGTVSRRTRKGFNRGTMPASRFFSDALAQNEQTIINYSTTYTLSALEKLIARHLKKTQQQ